MPNSEFLAKNSLNFGNLAANGTNLLQIGGKVAQNCGNFWRKIATSGHSVLVFSSCDKTANLACPISSSFVSSMVVDTYSEYLVKFLLGKKKQESPNQIYRRHKSRKIPLKIMLRFHFRYAQVFNVKVIILST